MLSEQRTESALGTCDRVAKTPATRAKSLIRAEIALRDSGESVGISAEIGFVLIQQAGQLGARAFVLNDAVPLRIPGEFGE